MPQTGESDFENVLDQVQITPIKVISPKYKSLKKDDKTMTEKETTFGDLLLEAMSNLQLSTKKCCMNQSVTNLSTETFKTPRKCKKRITRSMSAHINSEDVALLTSSKSEMPTNDIDILSEKSTTSIKNDGTGIEASTEKNHTRDVDEHLMFTRKMPSKVVTCFKNEDIVSCITSTNEECKSLRLNTGIDKLAETSHNENHLLQMQTVDDKDKKDRDDTCISKEKKNIPSRIVTSFGSRNTTVSTKPDAILTKKRPHLLTSIRRHSLVKHKRNDQYVSLAEAVSKFQKGTPKRFRTVSLKDLKPGPVTTFKQAAFKITRPISPVLTSKTRVRPVKALSHEQKEALELEKGISRPIRANPVPALALKNVKPVKKNESNCSTKPEPFNLSQSRKTCHFSSSESLSVPKSRKICNSSVSSLNDALHHRDPTQKKIVHTIVSTEDANLAVKEIELGHFGIPTEPCDKPKKFTRTLPFSFEIRNKEFQNRKEQKLKQLQSEEGKKIKFDFHAKPVPTTNNVTKEQIAAKGKITPKQNSKELSAAKKTTPCPFSFEERNKLLIMKKNNLIKEALEKDKKARVFHANPVPAYRPVIIRGRSRENIRMEEKTPDKQKTNKPKINSLKNNTDDQENKKPNVIDNHLPKPEFDMITGNLNSKMKKSTVLTELNTDKRAKERKGFEEKLKRKDMEEEELRRKEEQERFAREKAEKVQLRKMAEIKARPMPQYKPISIVKSNKPLTDPQSPAWVRKTKG